MNPSDLPLNSTKIRVPGASREGGSAGYGLQDDLYACSHTDLSMYHLSLDNRKVDLDWRALAVFYVWPCHWPFEAVRYRNRPWLGVVCLCRGRQKTLAWAAYMANREEDTYWTYSVSFRFKFMAAILQVKNSSRSWLGIWVFVRA